MRLSPYFEYHEPYNRKIFLDLFRGPEIFHALWALQEKLQMGSNLTGSLHIPLRTFRRGVLKLFVKLLIFWATLPTLYTKYDMNSRIRAICPTCVDDQMPSEFQASVETLNKPNHVLLRCVGRQFCDEDGLITTYRNNRLKFSEDHRGFIVSFLITVNNIFRSASSSRNRTID